MYLLVLLGFLSLTLLSVPPSQRATALTALPFLLASVASLMATLMRPSAKGAMRRPGSKSQKNLRMGAGRHAGTAACSSS